MPICGNCSISAFSILPVRREGAELFTTDERLKLLSFTGSPEVGWDLAYQFKGTLGSIQRCYHVDRDRTFGLLYEKLRDAYGA